MGVHKRMSVCHGNREDHCCYVNGEACRFLVENVNGRRWACGLYVKYGSWEGVHADPGYQEYVQSYWDQVGIESCGAWGPGSDQCCFGESETEVSIR